jgi:hypothetical protein
LMPIEKNNFNVIFYYLDKYIQGKRKAIMYFDICAFNSIDHDLFNEILNYEMNKNENRF